MINPSKKMKGLNSSVFSQLAEKKQEQLLQGRDMIDLSIGSPDLPPPPTVKECLAHEVLLDDQYAYALTATQEFKEAVTFYYATRFGVKLDSEEVLQLMGSQDGLSHLAIAYLDAEDVVLVPNPGYPIYSASVHIAGAEIYPMPLKAENQYMPLLEDIPDEICKRAKMMILSYPGNPISFTATREFFEKVIQFGIKHQIMIVHDFAYSELLFDQRQPLSIFALPEAKQIALEFNSLSKSFNMAGCRIGYLIGSPHLLEPLAILKSHIDYGVFYPIQKAASIALTNGFSFLDEHRQIYQNRRDAFIKQISFYNWKVEIPHGGMFIWAKLPGPWNSLDFCLTAIEHGVIVTPGSAFGSEGEGYVRIALVQPEGKLEEAARRLRVLFS